MSAPKFTPFFFFYLRLDVCTLFEVGFPSPLGLFFCGGITQRYIWGDWWVSEDQLTILLLSYFGGFDDIGKDCNGFFRSNKGGSDIRNWRCVMFSFVRFGVFIFVITILYNSYVYFCRNSLFSVGIFSFIRTSNGGFLQFLQ